MNTAVRIYPHELDKLFNSPLGPVAKDLERKAIKVDRLAKHFCPVDTGRLRASIRHELKRDNKGLFAEVGSDVNYAIYQELGTRYIAPRAFLRRALAEGLR